MDAQLSGLRQLAAQIVGHKRERPDDAAHMRQLASEGLLRLLALKDGNKKHCFQAEEVKECTARSKAELEKADLVLQNLLYEKQYYEKEILSCRSFQSKVKDEQVALMPAEACLASLASSSDEQDRDAHAKALTGEHELMKARLVHENKQRKQLVKKLEQIKQMKVSLLQNVGQQERVLKDLQSQLKTLADSSKPLATVLMPTASLRGSMSRAADLLPTPLYVIYSQIVAAREALGVGCNAVIQGNSDEAESYARSLASEAIDDGKRSTAGGAAPAEAAGQAGAPAGASTSKTVSEDVYKAHPLSVEVEVHKEASVSTGAAKSPGVAITVIFQYLPALRVVTAHCAQQADNAVLKGLFPGDDGSGLPLELLSQLEAGTFKFSSSKTERPYRWAQHLAGLDFVPTLPILAAQLGSSEQESVVSGLDTYRKQQRVLTVIQRLRDAKHGDATLTLLYTDMLKSPMPPNASMYPRTPTSLIMTWEELTSSSIAAPPPPTPRPSGRTPIPRPAGGAANQQQQSEGNKPQELGLDEGEVPAAAEQPAAHEGGEEGANAAEAMDTEGAADGGEGVAADGEGAQGDEGAMEEDAARPSLGSRATPEASDPHRARRSENESGRSARLLLDEVEEEAAAAAGPKPLPKPASRLFKLVLRSGALELEAHVRVFAEYPVRPPLVLVVAVRELTSAAVTAMTALLSKGGSAALKAAAAAPAGKALEGAMVNSMVWMEQQANVEALAVVPPHRLADTLLYQLTHLRLCLDEVTSQHTADAAGAVQVAKGGAGHEDLSASVLAKQRLRGRDRHPAAPIVLA